MKKVNRIYTKLLTLPEYMCAGRQDFSWNFHWRAKRHYRLLVRFTRKRASRNADGERDHTQQHGRRLIKAIRFRRHTEHRKLHLSFSFTRPFVVI
jgi:hypothetical protein